MIFALHNFAALLAAPAPAPASKDAAPLPAGEDFAALFAQETAEEEDAEDEEETPVAPEHVAVPLDLERPKLESQPRESKEQADQEEPEAKKIERASVPSAPLKLEVSEPRLAIELQRFVESQPKIEAPVAMPIDPMERIEQIAAMPRIDLSDRDLKHASLTATSAKLEIGEGKDKIALDLRTNEKTVTVEASVGNPELAVRLVDAAHELRSSLHRHGLSLGSFVSTTTEDDATSRDGKRRRQPEQDQDREDGPPTTKKTRAVFTLA